MSIWLNIKLYLSFISILIMSNKYMGWFISGINDNFKTQSHLIETFDNSDTNNILLPVYTTDSYHYDKYLIDIVFYTENNENDDHVIQVQTRISARKKKLSLDNKLIIPYGCKSHRITDTKYFNMNNTTIKCGTYEIFPELQCFDKSVINNNFLMWKLILLGLNDNESILSILPYEIGLLIYHYCKIISYQLWIIHIEYDDSIPPDWIKDTLKWFMLSNSNNLHQQYKKLINDFL